MKATAIAVVSVALIGILFSLKPAEAKREDQNFAQSRVTNIKSGLKPKAKKFVIRKKVKRRKPVLGGKPVASNAVAVKRPRLAIRPAAQTPKRIATKLRRKRVLASMPVSLRPKLEPRVTAAKRFALLRDPPVKAPKPVVLKLAPKSSLSRTVSSQIKPEKPPEKIIAKIGDVDGLPPFARANSERYERDARTEAAAMIVAMAPCQNVPVWFALRVAMTESSLNPKARGGVGEIGLFQMRCATARFLGFAGRCDELFDARTNIYWGLKHLSRALQSSDGNLSHAASKHNGGLGLDGLRPEYVEQVMCSSARSGFPTAFQLGASPDIQRMCVKNGGPASAAAGPHEKQDLLTSSIGAIGAKTVLMARRGAAPLSGNSCNVLDLEQSPVLAKQTDVKSQ